MMNEDFAQTLTTLRAELNEVKAKLARLENVVKLGEDEEGNQVAVLVCHGLNIHPVNSPDEDAIQLGTDDNGGYLLMHYAGAPEENTCALQLGLDEAGEPHISLFGRDEQLRAETTIQNDSGMTVLFSEEGIPAVIAQTIGQRGVVTVCDAEGEATGSLPPVMT